MGRKVGDERAHLLDYPRQSAFLESHACVPLRPDWLIQRLFKLRFTCVWIWKIFHEVTARLFVLLFRQYQVCFARIRASVWRNAGNLLDKIWSCGII
jgi:hypothetical protein